MLKTHISYDSYIHQIIHHTSALTADACRYELLAMVFLHCCCTAIGAFSKPFVQKDVQSLLMVAKIDTTGRGALIWTSSQIRP